MERVRRPSVTSINLLLDLASSRNFFIGDDFGLTTARTRLATTVLPKPTLIIELSTF